MCIPTSHRNFEVVFVEGMSAVYSSQRFIESRLRLSHSAALGVVFGDVPGRVMPSAWGPNRSWDIDDEAL